VSKTFKSGFVALIGRPNVGKSTVINQILGRKISIISKKPQTTRNQIRGIYTTEEEQIIFIDTPGIHKPQHELGNYMNKESISTLSDVDLILLIIDGTRNYGKGDEFVLELLKKMSTPVFLVVNKIDLIKNKNRLLENVVQFQKNFTFEETFYISALQGDNVDLLLENISNQLEAGPKYYPEDQVSDCPEVFIIAEIIREKVLTLTEQEVPHSVAVVVEEIEKDEVNPDLLNIRATIYVERPSQKKIIIGSEGTMIKEIGTQARKDIVKIVGQKVYLELWVKVEENWRNKKTQLRRMGYFFEEQK
jgi:GTP-binding protein Era